MDNSLSVQMNRILDEYDKEVQRTVDSSFDSISRESVQKLKSTSPKRTGAYARGWTRKKQGLGGRVVDYVVHNSSHYQLTHLLENGHVVRNKYGTYGRVAGNGKIKAVEQWANQELVNRIEREL